MVLTGGKLRKEIYAAFEQIYPVLQVRGRARDRARVRVRVGVNEPRSPMLQEFRKSTVDAPPVAA